MLFIIDSFRWYLLVLFDRIWILSLCCLYVIYRS